MWKKSLLLVVSCVCLLFITACGDDANREQSGEPDVTNAQTDGPDEATSVLNVTTDGPDEAISIFNVTILEIHDEPQDDWYFDQMTVLVTSEEHGRMIFDHTRLEDIGATVGDIVELTIIGYWTQPDPSPVHPDSWRLVD